MGSKTYLPTLKWFLTNMCKYIAKYRSTIVHVIGDANVPKLDAVIAACDVLVPVLDTFIPDGH